MMQFLKNLFRKKSKAEVTYDQEVESLKRVQEIIELTDAIHTSLENNIRKRLKANAKLDELEEEGGGPVEPQRFLRP